MNIYIYARCILVRNKEIKLILVNVVQLLKFTVSILSENLKFEFGLSRLQWRWVWIRYVVAGLSLFPEDCELWMDILGLSAIAGEVWARNYSKTIDSPCGNISPRFVSRINRTQCLCLKCPNLSEITCAPADSLRCVLKKLRPDGFSLRFGSSFCQEEESGGAQRWVVSLHPLVRATLFTTDFLVTVSFWKF